MANSISSSLIFSRNEALDSPPLSDAVSDCEDRAIMKHRGAVSGRAYPRVVSSTTPPHMGCWTRADFRNGSIAPFWPSASHFRGRDASYLAPPRTDPYGPNSGIRLVWGLLFQGGGPT